MVLLMKDLTLRADHHNGSGPFGVKLSPPSIAGMAVSSYNGVGARNIARQRGVRSDSNSFWRTFQWQVMNHMRDLRLLRRNQLPTGRSSLRRRLEVTSRIFSPWIFSSDLPPEPIVANSPQVRLLSRRQSVLAQCRSTSRWMHPHELCKKNGRGTIEINFDRLARRCFTAQM